MASVRESRERYVVDAETGCWIWQLSTQGKGYGQVCIGGRRAIAHRYYYELHRGPVADGLELDHLCRNKLCVNPDHLEAVTHAENLRRGKHTKLTMDQAREIAASSESAKELSHRYGVTQTNIYLIRKGRRWAVA